MSDLVELMIEFLETYFGRIDRTNLIPYIMAKQGPYYFKSGLNPTNEGREIIESLVTDYFNYLRECQMSLDVLDWDEEGTEECIFYKPFLAEENLYFESGRAYDPIDNTRFLKRGYEQRFFCVDVPLSRIQSIHLFQKVTTGYETTNRIHIPLFERRNRVHIADHKRGFTIKNRFDFSSFYDNTNVDNCFSIVSSRKPFERLFGYIERYKEAFESVSRFEYIDFSFLGEGSEDLWRKCHSLLRFPDLDRCIEAFTAELRSGEQTLSKQALEMYDIEYVMTREGIPVVKPLNLRQSKHVIRILTDGIAETYYCKTHIIAKSYARI